VKQQQYKKIGADYSPIMGSSAKLSSTNQIMGIE
jgi:hypothetical protein